MKQEIIRLGSACNQKCLFCNQEGVFDAKEKKEILKELLGFKRDGVERLVISGGEPTLFRKQLYFTLELGKKLGFKDLELQSNAVLLRDYSYAEKLKELGLQSAMISLHSLNSEVSDSLTQAKGTFDHTLVGIQNLLDLGIITTINMVFNKQNYTEAYEYVKFIHTKFSNFEAVSLSVVVPGKLTIENDLLPKYSTIAPFLSKAYQYCIDNDIDFVNPGCGIPVCFVKDYYEYSLEYENFSSGDEDDEFILEKNSNNKSKTAECSKCVFDKFCLGLWNGYVEKYGFSEVQAIEEL